jgi:hypothetical protein
VILISNESIASATKSIRADKCRPKREIFSPTWYRTFSESYRSRFSSGVMETFYLLSTFGKHESASVCQRFIQAATFWLRIRLNGMFLGQNVFEDVTSWIHISLNISFHHRFVFDNAASRLRIRLNGMFLGQNVFEDVTRHRAIVDKFHLSHSYSEILCYESIVM